MSYNNELYIFSEVPGYDASKGERLVPSCNVNMNMNNLGSTDIASEVVVSDTREVEIADILVGMPVETVSASCEVNDEQPLIALQPLLDASSQGIILQPQEEIVGADSESEGLSAYEQISVSTSDGIYDSSSQTNKRGRKGKRMSGKGKLTDEQMSENKRAARKWDRKQVQIKTLEAGIVKAFRKLRAKIEHLEQVRISEKNTCSQNIQANNDPELTITDVQSEMLLTQIRYIIKILRESANDKQSSPEVNKDTSEKIKENASPSSDNLHFKPEIINNNQSKHEKSMQTDKDVLGTNSAFKNQPEPEINMGGTSTAAHTSQQQINSTDSHARVLQKKSKLNSHPHYHLKLDDVPFILGASSSASHSVVANVQNIIAMMKSHNKALCAPKLQARSRTASSSNVNIGGTTDSNEMFHKISEELSSLSQRQKKLGEMFDKLQTNEHEKVKSEISLKKESSGKSKMKLQHASNSLSSDQCAFSAMDQEKKQSKKKLHELSQKHAIPTIRMQTNNNPQLARRKMLRSLKDFKTHLSEEDISWE